MNKYSKEKLVLDGIWTPNARVICYKCHGKVFPNMKENPVTKKFEDLILTDEEFEKRCTPQPLHKNNHVTICNKCGKEVQLFDSVAYENNLCEKLKKHNINAYMAQTGGMNSAIEIRTKDEGFAWITYDGTGSKEWYVGFYDFEGDCLDDYYVAYNDEDIIEYILGLDCLI